MYRGRDLHEDHSRESLGCDKSGNPPPRFAGSAASGGTSAGHARSCGCAAMRRADSNVVAQPDVEGTNGTGVEASGGRPTLLTGIAASELKARISTACSDNDAVTGQDHRLARCKFAASGPRRCEPHLVTEVIAYSLFLINVHNAHNVHSSGHNYPKISRLRM